MKLYPQPSTLAWLGLTLVGAIMSALSVREVRRGIEAVQLVALRRPHARDVLEMARRNLLSEYGRFMAQILFCLAGVLALISKPRRFLSPPSVIDRALPWILVGVEGILVGNSANEYFVSQRVLRRRAEAQSQSTKGAP